MGTCKTAQLLCALLTLPIAAEAQNTPIVVTPAYPSAYEPFELTFSTHNGGIGWPVNVSVDGSTLTVEYAATDSGFVPEEVQVTTTVAGLAPGTYAVKLFSRVGSTLTQSPTQSSVSVAPIGETQQIHAFFNHRSGHYFITASVAERDGIVQGMAGDGWFISDKGFNGWPAAGAAPDAAKPVCRFYSQVVNSHFYTAGAAECEGLKQAGSGWAYEGIAFRALIPKGGSCPGGTVPIWRLYNDRAAQADSNHRFVASGETYRSMIANGWVAEGVAFCSPN
ncbi:MAG: hypothetical protein J0H09_00820 [Burkholderiales bacterium]|nr:hypothetical protein [Burkholderiales bacterium]